MSSASHQLNANPRIKMKPVPSHQRQLLTEARALGMLGPSPNLKNPRAQLLSFINDSKKIGRGFNQASILLVGSSGVGKSSTINHLLNIGEGIQFAKTSSSQSETRTTSEFILTADEPKYAVADLQLGVVDTPGFNDTAGTKQDASNFYSIKRFYETHKNLSGCYPNLVFLLVQATDTRIQGMNSNLSKSLRCLKELGLVDQYRPNVVAILSFCCSISHKNVAKWSEKIEAKRRMIQEVICQALNVAAPVVMLENDYGEDDYDLDVCGEFTRLPNGVLQPKNLYLACKEILRKNNDNLGLITLNACFTKQKKNGPIHGHQVAARDASKDKLDNKEGRFVAFFEKAARGGGKDSIFDTAQHFIEKKELKPEQQEEVQELASTLKRMGVEEKNECASISQGSVEYFHAETISSTGTEMLEKEFGIPNKAVSLDSGRLIGQGYNILNDKSTPCQIMNFEIVPSSSGIVVPTCAKFEKVNETLTFMDQFEDQQSYTKSRLTNLNVSLDVEYQMFTVKARAGYNNSTSATGNSSATEYSFLLEQRMFELKIANYEEYLRKKEITFTSDFKSAVEKLPEEYDQNNAENRSIFERFFNRFGHFIVSSAYGGGAIEIKVTNQKSGSEGQSFDEIKATLSACFSGGLWSASGEVSGSDSSSSSATSKSLISQSTMHWFGGNRDLHIKDTVAQREKMLKWQTSLLVNPAMLTTEMTLEPISTLIACIDPNKDQASYNALKDFLGGEFKVVASREKEREEENRRKQEEAEKKAEEAEKKAEEANTREETVEEPESSTGCFPSKSIVLIKYMNGSINQKQMVDLCVGDKVLAWDARRHRAITSEVIMFAHWQPNAVKVEYLKIILQDGNSITLSANHLVMTGEHCEATMAQNVKQDHVLFTINKDGELSPMKVVAVEKITESGVFCPITAEGNLLVNNVLASCYASVNDHVFLNGLFKVSAQSVAHLGLMPMRILRKFHSKWVAKIPKDDYIHPYVKWLCKLKLPWMDGELDSI